VRLTYAVLGIGLAVAGCAKGRDVEAPADVPVAEAPPEGPHRPTTQSAYTEDPGVARIDLSVGGTAGSEFGVSLGLRVGLPLRFELSTNVAHYGFGMFNLNLAWNPVTKRHFAFGVQVGAILMRPQWMWYMDIFDAQIPGLKAKMTLIGIPVVAKATFPIVKPVYVSAAFGYDHTDIFGTIDATVLWFEGSIGTRTIWAGTSAHFLIGKHFMIELGGKLPIMTWAATALEVTSNVEPGVEVGVRTAEWKPRPGYKAGSLLLAGELQIGKTHLRLGAGTAPLMRTAGFPVFPFAGAYWRIQ